MSSSTSLRLLAASVVGALLLAGCGSSDSLEGTVVKDGLACVSQVDQKGGAAPTIEKVTETPKKVVTKDLAKGKKGCAADGTNYLTLDLVGAQAADARVFTDTFASKRPVTAKLATGQLLPGLETGLTDMKVGDRRQITIPAAEAYGKDGNAAQEIGPDQALVFVVDLVAVTPTVQFCNAINGLPAGKAGAGKPTTVDMPIEAPTVLKKTDLKVGTGKAAKKGNYVTVQYLGVSCSSGQQFDSSWDKGEPFPVTLGEGTIPGFGNGIVGMKVGGLRQIDIPSALGYGAEGSPPAIAANDPLTFVVQVVALADKPPATTTTAAPSTTAPASTTTAPAGTTTTTGK